MNRPWIVMRSKDEARYVGATCAAVRRQTVPARLLNVDSGSRDGTLEIVQAYTDRLVQLRPEDYVPGRVLNQAMAETDGEVVVFLNADATPVDDRWLERLLAAAERPGTAAVYGRQVARPDASFLVVRDTERAFGDGAEAARWWHFFSMANSAVCREAWSRRPFDPDIRYSEDVEWTWWARGAGWAVRYVADAAALHSHDYTLAQAWRRHFGEGDADARIHPVARWRASLPAYVLLATLREWLRDAAGCLRAGHLRLIPYALALRLVQRSARWRGYWHGLRRCTWAHGTR